MGGKYHKRYKVYKSNTTNLLWNTLYCTINFVVFDLYTLYRLWHLWLHTTGMNHLKIMGGSLFPTVHPVSMHQATLAPSYFLQCVKSCVIVEINPTTPYLVVTIKKSLCF